MKTKLPYIAVVAILVSACTTGTYMTKTYDDDIYFSPGDVPPVTMVQGNAEKPAGTSKSDAGNQRIVMSQMEKNADGTSTLNNYVYQPDENNQNSSYQAYDMDQQELIGSDTTVYYNDDDVKYVINNYYDGSDIDFAYRINRFHRPYHYSPFFYDSWNYGSYYPFYSHLGWDPWYYGGWGYPYSSYGYYSPFSFGFGGYWGGGYGGYYNSYYGGYYNGYNHGYYSGYYGGGGGFSSNHQVARRRSTDMNVPGGRTQNNNITSGTRGSSFNGAIQGNSSDQKLPTNGANSNTWVENGHTRSRSINPAIGTQDNKSATIVNNRRTTTTVDGRRVTTTGGTQVRNENVSGTQVARPTTDTQGNVRRSYQPSTTGRTYDQGRAVQQGQNYTPSYNKPRIVNQSNYNNNSYIRPSTSVRNSNSPAVRSATNGTQTYSAPRSSSTVRQTYRSSSTYSSGSSSSPSRSPSTYSSPSSGSSSPSYNSTPSRSYSAPASSGGSSGGSSSGSSSRSSSGSSSGGGSGHRR